MAEPGARIVHHDLCFGCGQANRFGLQLEVSAREGGGVAGRFFVKQDHQGPPGFAHGGVLATALDETMALLLHAQGALALTARFEVELLAPVPIGTFVEVEAAIEEEQGRRLLLAAEATAQDGGETLARARGTLVRISS